MDKSEFVKDILTNSKYLSLKNRERLLSLCVPLMVQTKNNDDETIICHNPKVTRDFLSKFSSDYEFKWFTHDLSGDNVKSLDEYSKRAEEILWEKYSDIVNYNTFNNVLKFISLNDSYRNKKWENYNGEKVDYCWASVQEMCKKNPDKNPFDFSLGKFTFSEYIKQFKHTIQFRTDESDRLFINRIMNLLNDKLSEEIVIDYSDNFNSIGGKIDSYIDVRLFFKILQQICKWINNHTDNSIYVDIDLSEDENFYELSIFHKGSFLNVDNDKLKGLTGDWNKIRVWAFMTLNFEIIADVGTSSENSEGKHIICMNEGYKGRLNIHENGMYIIDTLNDILPNAKVEGVKYIFKFYR